MIRKMLGLYLPWRRCAFKCPCLCSFRDRMMEFDMVFVIYMYFQRSTKLQPKSANGKGN